MSGIDHGDRPCGQVPVAGETWVAVVETDEVGATEGTLCVNTGDVEVTVADSAGGEHHGVVVVAQLVDGDVAADGDVAQEAQAWLVQHVVQGLHDSLDAWVVRCDTVTDESEGGGHLLEEVDVDLVLLITDEEIGGVDAGGAGTDDGDAQWGGHLLETFRARGCGGVF